MSAGQRGLLDIRSVLAELLIFWAGRCAIALNPPDMQFQGAAQASAVDGNDWFSAVGFLTADRGFSSATTDCDGAAGQNI